jgi:hypothetical protein
MSHGDTDKERPYLSTTEIHRFAVFGYPKVGLCTLESLQRCLLSINKNGTHFFHVVLPVRPLPPAQKSTNVCVHQKKFIFKNAIWASKNAEFDADFKSVEKVAKRLLLKNYQQESDIKIELLTFITVCKSFAI